MSSIHYKFKATLEYKTLTFDGLHISVDELKRVICDKENIRTELFDLVLTNAHTKRQYGAGGAEELVPRNSSVVVQRLPRENSLKLPKISDTSTSGIVMKNIPIRIAPSHIETTEFSKMTEEQRLAHVKEVSYQKYLPSNYQRITNPIMSGPPPPTYVCNRCSQPGHWYKNCPLLTQKRTTGIPMEELMETTRDDPRAMLHPSGKFVVPIMHHQARLQRKPEQFPGSPTKDQQQIDVDTTKLPGSTLPDELTCRVCCGLLRNAVLATCCGDTFCDECVQQLLLVGNRRCPGSDCVNQLGTDSIVPNKRMRDAVQRYINTTSQTRDTEQAADQQQFGANKADVSNARSLVHQFAAPSLPGISAATTRVSSMEQTTQQQPQIQQQWQQGGSDVPSTIQQQVNHHLPPFDPKLPPPSIASSSDGSAATTFTPPPPHIQSASAAGNVPAIPSDATNLQQQQISSRITATTTATSTISGTSTDSGPPGDGADDRSSAWASFLKRSDTLVDSGAPKLFNLGPLTTSHTTAAISHAPPTSNRLQLQPITPSQEISEIWESFLKQKDQEKKLQQETNSSTTSSSSRRSSRSESRSTSFSNTSSPSKSKRRRKHSISRQRSRHRHSPLRRYFFTRGGMRSSYRSARVYGGRIGHDAHLSRRYPLHSVDISPLRNTSNKQEHKEASTSHTHRHSHSRSDRSSEKRERKKPAAEQNVGDGSEKDSKINRDRDKSKKRQTEKKVNEAKTTTAAAKSSIELKHDPPTTGSSAAPSDNSLLSSKEKRDEAEIERIIREAKDMRKESDENVQSSNQQKLLVPPHPRRLKLPPPLIRANHPPPPPPLTMPTKRVAIDVEAPQKTQKLDYALIEEEKDVICVSMPSNVVINQHSKEVGGDEISATATTLNEENVRVDNERWRPLNQLDTFDTPKQKHQHATTAPSKPITISNVVPLPVPLPVPAVASTAAIASTDVAQAAKSTEIAVTTKESNQHKKNTTTKEVKKKHSGRKETSKSSSRREVHAGKKLQSSQESSTMMVSTMESSEKDSSGLWKRNDADTKKGEKYDKHGEKRLTDKAKLSAGDKEKDKRIESEHKKKKKEKKKSKDRLNEASSKRPKSGGNRSDKKGRDDEKTDKSTKKLKTSDGSSKKRKHSKSSESVDMKKKKTTSAGSSKDGKELVHGHGETPISIGTERREVRIVRNELDL